MAMVEREGGAEERPASPFVEMIGGRLDEWREGYVRMSLTLEEHHTNPNGVMHGGVVTTLMDEALGGVIASVRGLETMFAAPHATVEMNASFLAGARPGDRIEVEARVLRLGRRVAFGEAEARRGDGELIAKGRMTFVILEGGAA
ncbi:MAG: PaaI family thioesterase [Dehalococcoidia bacterium]|nr:PaaI family thioesterase [Dehalococcoidia bacterium]